MVRRGTFTQLVYSMCNPVIMLGGTSGKPLKNCGKVPLSTTMTRIPQLSNPPIEGVQQRPSIVRSVGRRTVHMLTCT